MKVAYFDCQFGAAGDMLNAALLAAGADEQAWRRELAKLDLGGQAFTLKVTSVMRCNIACRKVDVLGPSGQSLDAAYRQQAAQRHEAEHEHGHGEHHFRNLKEIVSIIHSAGLSPKAAALAVDIFSRLAQAESQVHGVTPEQVHFHEVGAVDAIVDIVGFAVAYDLLGIEKSYCSAVAVGSGKCKMEHGVFPVPGPATLYLLSQAGAAIAQSGIDFECLTPTGAAILCAVASSWGVQPGLERVEAAGYGAGTRDPGEWPNACRVVLGTAGGASGRFDSDMVSVLQANLDDLNPQAVAFSMEKILAEGALDVYLCPAVMKKGRAGQVLTVLCRSDERARFEDLILSQTSTIGVRSYEARRAVALRRFEEVQLDGHSVRLKVAFDREGNIINVQPEYEDCAAYASAHNVPLKDVLNQAMARFLERK